MTEDVDEDGFDLFVIGEDFECFDHLLLGGAAADIEEVGRRSAVEFDDVHRRHRQTRSVDQTANAAIQPNVIQIILLSTHFPNHHLFYLPRRCRCSTYRGSCWEGSFRSKRED